MRVIRRRVRSFFALQAIILFVVAITGVIRPAHAHPSASLLRYYAVTAVYVVFSLVFATAWWNTRKPKPFRDPWAIAASVLSLISGAGMIWLHHTSLELASPGFLVVAIGAAGLYFFAQGGPATTNSASGSDPEAPEPALAPQKLAPVKGDRTHPGVNYLVTAITFAAEVAAIFYWSHWAHTWGLTNRGALPWFILFTFAVLISTIVHECGHAFFAWGCYMKLLSFNAGPLRWQKHEGQWAFKFHPAGFVELGGSVRAVPTNPKQPRIHELWTIFAGPLANILFGLTLLWVLFSVGLPHFDQTWRLVAFTASFCFIVAVTNLFPFMTEDGGYSDGARMLQIVTKSPIDEYHRAVNSIASTLVCSQRYRDLDATALELASDRFPNDARGVNLLLCLVNCYQDRAELPYARIALAAAEAIYTDNAIDLPASLHRPFVIGHAMLNRDAAAARLWWDRMEAKPAETQNDKPTVDYWLAQAALAWIEGRIQQAEEACQKAEHVAQKLPECGSGDWDRDRCTLLRKQLEAPAPVPAPQPAVVRPPSTSAERIARRTAVPTPAPVAAPTPTPAVVSTEVAAPVDELPSVFDRIARRPPAPPPPPAPAPAEAGIATPEPVPEDTPELISTEAVVPTPELFSEAVILSAVRSAESKDPDASETTTSAGDLSATGSPEPTPAPVPDPTPVVSSIGSELPSVFDRIARRPPTPAPVPAEALIPTPNFPSEAVILTLSEVKGKDPDASDTATSAENISATASSEPLPDPIEDTIPVFASVASNTPFLVDRIPASHRVPIAEAAPLAEPLPEALPILEAAPAEAPTPAIDWAALIAAAQEAEAQAESEVQIDAQTEAQTEAEAPIDTAAQIDAPLPIDAAAQIDDSLTANPWAAWATESASIPTETSAPATDWAVVPAESQSDAPIEALGAEVAGPARHVSRWPRPHRRSCHRLLNLVPRASPRPRTTQTRRNPPLRPPQTHPRSPRPAANRLNRQRGMDIFSRPI